MHDDLDTCITKVNNLNLRSLRAFWADRFSSDPPPVRSADFLKNLIIWKLQTELHGGISNDARRRLNRLSKGFDRDPSYIPVTNHGLKTGTVLTREWRGTQYHVQVLKDGIEYDGKRYKSLSEVASHITGARWSGPLFFGLKKSLNKRASP